MATKIITTTFQLRRGTANQWIAKDPVLALGEPGFEVDNNKLKIGDGVKKWSELDYVAGGGGSGTGDYNDLANKPIINLASGAVMASQNTGIYKVAAGTWKMTANDNARSVNGNELFYVYKNTVAGTTSVTLVTDDNISLFTAPIDGAASSVSSKTLLAYEDLVGTF